MGGEKFCCFLVVMGGIGIFGGDKLVAEILFFDGNVDDEELGWDIQIKI